MSKYLMLDMPNLFHRAYRALDYKSSKPISYVGFDAPDDNTDTDNQAMLYQSVLFSVLNYFNTHKPDKIIMFFDKPNWRKEYTKSEKCISGLVYKGKRNINLTSSERESLNKLMEYINTFEEMIENHTSIIKLSCDRFEADDLIYGACEYLMLDDNEVVIISSDKDMMQLLRHKNVTLIEPTNNTERNLNDWNGDADFYTFEKCIRGDVASDNIPNIYPRLRRTKIIEMYTDEYKFNNFLNEPAKIPSTKEDCTVGDLFYENKLLIDLYNQPEEHQKVIMKTVLKEINRERKFSYFNILKFFGEYKLKKLSKGIDNFIKILNC